jgi:uncharacterized protein YqgC (DUF456 family)
VGDTGRMESHILIAVACGLLIAVGIAGVVIPVLPGSPLIIGALLLWAVTAAVPSGWAVFAVGTAFALGGMLAGAVLTGRTLRERRIPGRSVMVALLAGVVGMFVIPVIGLFVGFAAGLFAGEFVRQRDAGAAVSSSVVALKATGLGILAELALAFLAGTTWVVGVWVYFAGR